MSSPDPRFRPSILSLQLIEFQAKNARPLDPTSLENAYDTQCASRTAQDLLTLSRYIGRAGIISRKT